MDPNDPQASDLPPEKLLSPEDKAAAFLVLLLLLVGSVLTGVGADLGLEVIGMPGKILIILGLIGAIAIAYKWGKA
jgi:hypothetical protein